MPPALEHPTVFYSWQSDAPSSSNRGLIKDALDAAVKSIAMDESIEVVPRVDHDTAGVAGSPDIGVTILAKIDAAAVFVADVSLVLEDPASKRKSPNPNVLFELGYAWKSHGAARVILVVNDHFGGPELLPFDLKTKRALRYTNDPDVSDRAAARKQLASAFESALRLAFDGLPKPPPPMSTLETELKVGYRRSGMHRNDAGHVWRHDYVLTVELVNHSHRTQREWHIDIEMPARLRPSSTTYANQVNTRPDGEHLLLRWTSDERGPLRPGDTVSIEAPYMVDDDIFHKHHATIADGVVRATAFVDGDRAVLVERRVDELQNF